VTDMMNAKQAGVEWLLESMLKRMEQLEQAVEGLTRMVEAGNELLKREASQVTIEQLDIHQPQVEELTFRLDALDIQELSGMLNLGNNFTRKSKPLQPKNPSVQE
jgi:hypothetical protein